MPKYSVHAQGTSAWLAERRGCLTASCMADAMDIKKNGEPSKKRQKYQFELLAERLTDMAVEHYVTKAMKDGIEFEPLARDKYEEVTGNIVQQVGFCLHDTIPFFGASSDGLVGHDGMIEIKCCTTENHLAIVMAGEVPPQYMAQMTAQCVVTGRSWCDFVAFDPRVPDPAQIFHKRFTPTAEELALVTSAAECFLAELESMWEKLTTGEMS